MSATAATHLPARISLFFFAALSWAQYYPPSGPSWKKDDTGFDKAKLQEAVAFALTHDSGWDFKKNQVRTFGRPLGPVPAKRAPANLMIVRNGYIVAEAGETEQPDPVYSAAKSFLSVVCGLAVDRGMIRDVNDPVGASIKDGGYDSPHNAKVTWDHHLRQVSEWDGETWGKKHDFIGREEFGNGERKPRALKQPGSHYEYNDVRVNRFSLSLLRTWQEPLPAVLKRLVMDPIGASDTWQWLGYENSVAEVNGKQMVSVPGGTRWGGGIQMSTRDLARFGLLLLRDGKWDGRQILSRKWIHASIAPGPVGPDYGYLWWLNTRGKQWPSAPRTSFAAVGNGGNIVWIDPEHQLVVVWRWYEGKALDAFLAKLLASIR